MNVYRNCLPLAMDRCLHIYELISYMICMTMYLHVSEKKFLQGHL